MPRKKSNKERYNFIIDKDIYQDFSQICDELGLVRSKNIEIHMKEFNEQHKEVLKQVKKR